MRGYARRGFSFFISNFTQRPVIVSPPSTPLYFTPFSHFRFWVSEKTRFSSSSLQVMGLQSESVDGVYLEWPAKKVRDTFIKYFEGKNHSFWKSSPVVPVNDPTLLFANAVEMRKQDLLLTQRPRKFGSTTCLLSVCYLLVARTTSGRWAILVLVDLVLKFTSIVPGKDNKCEGLEVSEWLTVALGPLKGKGGKGKGGLAQGQGTDASNVEEAIKLAVNFASMKLNC